MLAGDSSETIMANTPCSWFSGMRIIRHAQNVHVVAAIHAQSQNVHEYGRRTSALTYSRRARIYTFTEKRTYDLPMLFSYLFSRSGLDSAKEMSNVAVEVPAGLNGLIVCEPS